MEIIVCSSVAQVGEISAAKVAHVARVVGPGVVIGVATGSSPLATYEQLAKRVAEGGLDLSVARVFALDEYAGLPIEHPESYYATINRTVTVPLGLDPAQVNVPDGSMDNLETAGPRYEQLIRDAGGVDVQILGIGSNGHIGFNEPTSSLSSRTRYKALTPSTREDNARFFDSIDQVPTGCVTQGLGTILDSRHAVLVAQGEGKAQAIAAMVEGPVTAMCPASVLQMHPDITVVIDEPAAGLLTMVEYYKYAYANKPEWQKYDV